MSGADRAQEARDAGRNAQGQGRIHCLLRAPGDVKESLGAADAKKLSWDLLWEVKETVDYTKYRKTDEPKEK